ncbi:Hypothetical protein NTJ_13425 [Nesidiocoris tenuis]|uniref:Coiled-coil domain-containing protein n=1 Tax=Nesidiocoris tenuis TaxID=355587 RepID=A0ABN7B8K1_9HEMI|nr:Hypothetical protein NTJ_13425 [Nesidiocoris tenuis]
MSTSNVDCQIGPMSPTKPISDTMPKRGKVTEMCKEWLVHEDGALAYQLQQQEVEKHYSGNKSRNAIVREDFPMALDAQRKAQDEAKLEYHRQVKMLEETDAQVAREIAEKLKREEEERRRRLEIRDLHMAHMIQERDGRAKLSSTHLGDANAVGLPLSSSRGPLVNADGAYGVTVARLDHPNNTTSPSPEPCYRNLPSPPLHSGSHRPMKEIEHKFRRLNVQQDDSNVEEWPLPPDVDQLCNADQEKGDEELAKKLQLEEQSAEFDMLDRDRMLAIEVQDLELAKMLQEKEKARLRRAKEKARAKALAKKQSEDSLHTQQSNVFRELDDALFQLDQQPKTNEDHMINIATAIDPTYVPPTNVHSIPFNQNQLTPTHCKISSPSSSGCHVASHQHSPSFSYLHKPENLLQNTVDEDMPPYMIVQGQRRTSSIEKKKKKKSKEGDCKPQ